MLRAQPFEIAALPDGGQVAAAGDVTLSLLVPDGRLFRRRAIKRAGTDQAQQVEWAVAELDGVMVYFNGKAVIVTREDILP